MGIPNSCARVSLIGHLGTQEQFDTSFWIGGAGVPTSQADANTLAGQIATQLAGPTLTQLASLIDTTSGYDTVRLYSYPTGGPGASYVGEAPITGGTGTGTGIMPLQQCMVVTLRTGLAGRSFRGRMYLPAVGRTLSTNHLFAGTDSQNTANRMASFFQAVNTLGSTNNVCVVSQTLSTFQEVIGVSVDQKPDIQRRRAASQSSGTSYNATV